MSVWTKLKNVKWPRLEYPITKEYPWRHFNLVAVIISIIVLVFLTFINIGAVGYETVSVLGDGSFSSTPNAWPSFIRKPVPSSCDAHQIMLGDIFRTNISAFQYQVSFVDNPQYTSGSSSESYTDLTGIEYTADPLATACNDYGDDEHLSSPRSPRFLRVNVDGMQKIVTGTVQFMCTFASASLIGVTASYTTSFMDDDELTGNMGLAYSIQRVLDLLATDLQVGMSLASSQSGIQSLSTVAQINCPSDNSSTSSALLKQCFNSNPVNLTLNTVKFLYSNGTVFFNGSNPTLPETLGDSVLNYLQALSAASLADIGIWRDNSIYVSPSIINATLQPNNIVSAALMSNTSYYEAYHKVGSSAAQSFRTENPPINVTSTPASISLTYICHVQQRKSLSNFIISVLVANLSLFATFWAAFTFMASTLAHSKTSPNPDAGDIERESAVPVAEFLPILPQKSDLRSP